MNLLYHNYTSLKIKIVVLGRKKSYLTEKIIPYGYSRQGGIIPRIFFKKKRSKNYETIRTYILNAY